MTLLSLRLLSVARCHENDMKKAALTFFIKYGIPVETVICVLTTGDQKGDSLHDTVWEQVG